MTLTDIAPDLRELDGIAPVCDTISCDAEGTWIAWVEHPCEHTPFLFCDACHSALAAYDTRLGGFVCDLSCNRYLGRIIRWRHV